MTELHHFCDRADRCTIFEDLRILDLRTDADLVGRRDKIDASWKRIVAAVERPKILKTDGTPDRRYDNWWSEDAKTWPILDFVDRLTRIAREGDLTDPMHVWDDDAFRGAVVDGGMVFFLDWKGKPIYLSGGYRAFLLNLQDLLALTKDLLQEAASRETL